MGSSRLRSAWPLCLASLLCVAACAAFLSAPLAWDDHGTITLNHALARPIPAKALLTQDYYRFSSEQSWRPLATASYLAMIRAFGKSPLAMRGVHLALHLANGLLAALLLEALGLPAAAAFWGAALFLVHPAHVETLFCVSFNEEILCALGLLVMLWAHLRGRAAVAAAGFAAALLAKETGVVGLPLAAACDLLAARDGIRRKASAYAAYAATLAAYLWAHFGPLAGPGGIGEAYALVPTERALYAAQSLATAARVFVLPIRLRIEYFALPPESLAEGLARAAASFAVVAAWLWAIARWRRKTPVLALLLLWPLAFLVLTSNAIPVKVLNMRLTAERWMYLPFIGAAGAAAYFLHKRPRLALGILLALAAGTWARARDWSDETRLWSSLLAIYPWCAKAEEGLGEAYSRQDRYPEALAAYERARELREARKDKVLRRYAELSAEGLVRWESPTLHRGLGRTYLKLDRVADADREFLKASALEPKDGYTYGVMAYRYAEAGDFKKAAEWTKRGLAAIPDDEFLRRIEPDVRKGRLTFRAGFH